MRRKLLIFFIFCVPAMMSAQKVDSIKVEQSGDFIKIRYKILNSNPDQLYRVKVLCSINGGLNTELRSVSGDTGDNIVGGKPEYFVVWDVLKDVDELRSAEFIVRADVISDNSPRMTKKGTHNFNILLSGQVPGLGYGARIGYMGKAGFSLQFIRGQTDYQAGFKDHDNFGLLRFSLDLTNRLMNKDASQIHLLTGVSVGETVIKDENNGNISFPVHQTPGLELGLAFCQKRTILVITAARLFPDLTEEGSSITKHTYLSFGFGLRL